MPSALQIGGRKFGQMTAVRPAARNELSPKQQKQFGRFWLFHCDCGNDVFRTATQISRLRAISCGCLRGTVRNGRLEFGLSAKRIAFAQTKDNAWRRTPEGELRKAAYAWHLTFDEFVALTSRPCVYCGISWSKEIGGHKQGRFGAYRYNGIDRIDSDRGYVLGNCAPCCKDCNRAKNVMSVDAFKVWVKRAFSHLFAQEKTNALSA